MRTTLAHRFVCCLALPLCLGGCGKSEPEPPPQVRATPNPSPTTADDGKEFSAKNIRRRADQAADSLEKYLKDQDPRLREKVQRLANKISDKLGEDKGRWREKLEDKRRELSPQIERLREKLGQIDGDGNRSKEKDKLKDALSKLEGKSEDTDKKLAELEAVGADAWKQFKTRLKESERKDDTDSPPPVDDPTPTPASRLPH